MLMGVYVHFFHFILGVLPCHFCKIAADHLLSIEAQNVTKIRDTLESVKLAVSEGSLLWRLFSCTGDGRVITTC